MKLNYKTIEHNLRNRGVPTTRCKDCSTVLVLGVNFAAPVTKGYVCRQCLSFRQDNITNAKKVTL